MRVVKQSSSMKLKIRDGHATINGDKTEYEMPSGVLDIISDDGKSLFSITLEECGKIVVSARGICRHERQILDDTIYVQPKYGNMILVLRLPYEEAKCAS